MRFFYKALSVALLSVLVACSNRDAFVEVNGAVWNTTFTIKYRGDEALADSIQTIMRKVEMSLSPFNERSLISRINRNETDSADALVAQVFTLSQHVSSLSDGAFDPTLSPLINLWGFGYENTVAEPCDSLIAVALTSVGIDSCSLSNGRITKKSPQTTFNFSAVTKGFGCDEIARMFRRNQVKDYMIEIGGELALGGQNDRGKPWRVMVDAPVEAPATHSKLVTIAVSDCGIATSGNYRNYRDTDSGRVGHTISAVTGRPVVTSTLSASVIAPDCATADALATACLAMPADSALAMIERIDGADCLLVTARADSLSIVTTPGFPMTE